MGGFSNVLAAQDDDTDYVPFQSDSSNGTPDDDMSSLDQSAVPDSSAFSLNSAQPAPPQAGMNPDGSPTMGSDAAYQSAPQQQGDGSAGNPIIVANPDAATNANTNTNAPISWRDVLRGALIGMSGAAQQRGRGSFAGGVGMGAGAAIANQQQQAQQAIDNANRQQQLQFQSVQAADSHITALNQNRRAGLLDKDAQLEYNLKSAQYQSFLADHPELGIKPDVTLDQDTTQQANAGLQTLAAQNGGTIPAVATINTAAPDGQHGSVAVMSPSQNAMQSSQGYRNLIDMDRQANGQAKTTDDEWNNMGFTDRKTAYIAAQNDLNPTHLTFSQDKNKPDYVGTQLIVAQQKLTNYQNNPNADPAVAKILQAKVDVLKTAQASADVEAENQKGGGPVDSDALKTFTGATLPSYTHIPSAQRAALAQEASEAKTKEDLNKIQVRADASEKSGQVHADTLAGQAVNKGNANVTAGLAANEKFWTDPKTGFSATLTQANTAKSAITAGAAGDGLMTSLAPTMELLGINHSAGMNRISPAEAQAAGAPGGWAEQWNAWANKAIQGNLSPQLAQEGQQLMDTLVNSKQQEAVRNSQLNANGRNIPYSQVPAMDAQGNVTTLDRVVPLQAPNKAAVVPAPRTPTVVGVIANKQGVVTGHRMSDGSIQR